MNELDNFKSKITYEKKPLYGSIAIIVVAVLIALGFMFSDWVRFILLTLPAAFLVIPKEKIRHNPALAIIFGIIVAISFCYSIWAFANVLLYHSFYSTLDWDFYVAHICTILIHVYLLFCAILLYIPTFKDDGTIAANMNNMANVNTVSNAKFCRGCGAKVDGNLAFCPECGKKL